MKVNIDGRGVLPGIGLLPVRGKELSKEAILRLLNFNARIYDANTGALITGPEFFKAKPAPAPVIKKSEPEVVVKKEPQPYLVPPAETVDTSKVEYVAPKVDVIPDKTDDVIPEEIETPAEEEIPYEIGIDVAPAEDVVVEPDAEETVETEEAAEDAPVEETTTAPQQNNNGYRPRNKKKHR